MDLTWEAPTWDAASFEDHGALGDGGSPITGYKVQWKEAADSWDTADDVSEATVTGTTHTITGLTDGVEYTVRVIAVNDIGDSVVSVSIGPHSAATGAPTISGTARVGEMLTASTTGISDTDGLDDVSYSYQWIRNDGSADSDIAGATGSTYYLVDDDQGKTIKVRVSFTDDRNNQESLTSAATSQVAARPNRPATGAPTISGTATVGQTLTASTSGIMDADGLDNVSYSYQWMRSGDGADSDIADATGSTYDLADVDQGKTIKVRVSFTDDRNNQESLTSAATRAVAATGAPTISGTATAGVPEKPRSVRVTTGPNFELYVKWKPPSYGGAPITSYTVQWRHDDEDYDVTPESTRQAVITDLYDFTHHSDLTHTINDLTKEGIYYVQVIATNSEGDGPAPVQYGVRRSTAPPELTCIEVNHSSLTLSYNKELDEYATPPVSHFVVTVGGVAHEVTNVKVTNWLKRISLHLRPHPCDWKNEVKLTLAERVIPGDEVEVGYTAPQDPSARRIQDEAGQPAASFSGQAATNKTRNSRARGLPTVTGTALVGQTLTASTVDIYDRDGLEDATFTFQWIANDGTADTDIEGAIDSTYELSEDEAGKVVKVQVSYTDDIGSLETLTSAATGTVAATAAGGAPQSVAVSPGGIQELEVSWDVPSDASGSPVTGYKVQWKSGDQDYDSSREMAVAGLSHTLTDLTEDVQHIVRVVTVHGDQDGSSSPGVSATPLSGEKTLLRFIENDIVATYGADYPWLRTVLEVIRRPGYLKVNHEHSSQGSVVAFCEQLYGIGSGENAAPLRKCYVSRMWIHPDHVTDKYTIVHEMAHIYTLRLGLPANPGRIAMAHLYFADLQSEWESSDCRAIELHADVLSMLTLGDGTGAHSSYWKPCNGDDTARTQGALSVVRSAVAGQTPQWFADTYNDSQGAPDLEQVWSDVKAIPLRVEPIGERINVASDLAKAVVVYQLRNEFGGYCDGRKASESVFRGGTTRNPWRDGGCVPDSVGTLTASAEEGQVSLSWETPAYDGGSPILANLVRWKSGSQEFDILRQESVNDPAVLTHAVSGLTNGVEYTFQVQAYNHNGGGAVSEVTATPLDATAPLLLATVASGATLTLTYSEALDENSSPQQNAFTVSGGAQNGESVGFWSRTL